MISLYVIEKDLAQILLEIEDAGGVVSSEMESKLAITQETLNTKCAAYGYVVMEKEGNVSLIDAEIKRLQILKAKQQSVIENLKTRVSDAMLKYGIDKIETPMLKLSFRKSESVDILDESLLNAKYFSYRPTIDKTAIKNDIKSGLLVEGATIVSKDNLQIK